MSVLPLLWISILATLSGCVVEPAPAARPASFEDVRRVIALLDEVAAEYPRANAVRMQLIETMLHDALLFGQRFPPDELDALAELSARVAGRGDARDVVDRARHLRRMLMADHQIVLAPAAPPDRARAVMQWDRLCAGCHGIAGMGDGPQGLGLIPEPKDFHEAAFMSDLAPSRAFSQISDGVRGTAMPQWGLFTTSERWGLAFLVFGFRHDPEAIPRGRDALAHTRRAWSLSSTADLTDAELLAALREAGVAEARVNEAIAFLRAEAPFAPPRGPFAGARHSLSQLATRYPARGPEPAMLLAQTRAGLAPQLDVARAADPTTAARIEHGLATLDRQIATNDLDERLQREVVAVARWLDDAEPSLHAPTVPGTLRLVLEWALAPALALGLWLASVRQRTTQPRPIAIAVGFAIAAAFGGAAIAAPAVAAGTTIAFAVVAVVAIAAVADPRAVAPAIALGILTGLPVGRLARSTIEVYGAAAIASVVVAGLALACATGLGWLVATRSSRTTHAVLTAVSTSVALAAACGRAAFAVTDGPPLAIWRIEALGVMPAAMSLWALALALVATTLAFAARLRASSRAAQRPGATPGSR